MFKMSRLINILYLFSPLLEDFRYETGVSTPGGLGDKQLIHILHLFSPLLEDFRYETGVETPGGLWD